VSDVYLRSASAMGTVVTMQVVGREGERASQVDRAMAWFEEIETRCTRFNAGSELRQLSEHVGEPVPASDILFEIVRFALALAEETGGAFDPTTGAASFRDIDIDANEKTITLLRPVTLDLGAVAKGFAVDMAARELAPLENFAIDAGGDLYLGGHNERGEPWSVGIRHPRDASQLLDTLRVSNTAVCTSGDYERVTDTGHHIIDPQSGISATQVASVTVVAPVAMVADGLATAAFVLGPRRGLALLERHGVQGLIVTPTLERFATP
jgi:FAD:protein FMN transferase